MGRVGCCLCVLFLALAVSEAIKCYSCIPGTGKGCGGDSLDKKIEDCPSGKCMKVTISGMMKPPLSSGGLTPAWNGWGYRGMNHRPFHVPDYAGIPGLHDLTGFGGRNGLPGMKGQDGRSDLNESPGEPVVARFCGSKWACNGCVEGVDGGEVCTCEGDLCNEATVQVVSLSRGEVCTCEGDLCSEATVQVVGLYCHHKPCFFAYVEK